MDRSLLLLILLASYLRCSFLFRFTETMLGQSDTPTRAVDLCTFFFSSLFQTNVGPMLRNIYPALILGVARVQPYFSSRGTFFLEVSR